jgi:hypothetical protein
MYNEPEMRKRAAFLLLPLTLLACGRDDIQVYRLAKPGGAEAPGEPSPPRRLPSPGGAADLAWATPARWQEEPASGMRAASFKVPGGAEVSVIVLDGDAGGPKANVDRWRAQVGLAALSQAEFAHDASRISSAAGELRLVDFVGAGAFSGRRVVAAILPRGGRSWFFKLSGPRAATDAAKPDFLALLRGLRAR